MNRRLILAAMLAAVPLLQGCFPIVAGGAAAGVLIADDRRTTGVYIEDENIEWKALARVHEKFKASHVNATSYNLRVLLTGEVADDETKKKVEEAVRAIQSVKDVANELAVGGNSSLTSRGNDSLVTTNVKARMVNNGKFSPNHVKVVTEAGTVYLMGLVSQAEGDAAVEIARTTQGASRIVKVFEYR
jgi:osmotically-inducible protein OsmY